MTRLINGYILFDRIEILRFYLQIYKIPLTMCLIGGLKTQKMLASTKIRQGRASSYIRTILHGELLFLYLLQNRENLTIQIFS